DLIEVDGFVILADAVGDGTVELAGEVDFLAMREVSAVGEAHAEERIAGLEAAEVGGHVGLGAGVRLHVRVLGAKERLDALQSQRLTEIAVFAAAVVAATGVALGVLVGQDTALGGEDRGAGVVL